MSEITITSAEVKRLSDALDARCADLDEQSTIHLQAIFMLAGEAAAARAADQEVSGFSFSFPSVGIDFAGAGRTVPWATFFDQGAKNANSPGGRVSINPQPLPPSV
jgi:hypothetical protein